MSHSVAIYVFEGINSFHLAIPNAVFREAFYDKASPFNVTYVADSPGSVGIGGGLVVTGTGDLSEMQTADIVVIPSWEPAQAPSPQFMRHIRQAHTRGATIVGLCLGTYALAYAGLLEETTATTHWQFEQDFRQRFPQVSLEIDQLYVHAGNVYTSGGAASGLDCCLYMLSNLLGKKQANDVARTLVAAPQRDGGQKQYIPVPLHEPERANRLTDTLAWIEQHLEHPHTLGSVAKRCNVSERTLSRRFQSELGTSFNHWLVNRRLERVQSLLESSRLSITQIVEKTGFGTEENMRKQFKARFSVAPSVWRRRFFSEQPV